jgi:hypothetical protein
MLSSSGWYFDTFVGASYVKNFLHSNTFLPYLHNSNGNVQTINRFFYYLDNIEHFLVE